MSLASVRIALESKLNAMTPTLSTAWENVPFTPVTGTPYQRAYLMPATPANPTMGDGYYREQGIFQVSLFYPLQAGPVTAAARAILIQTTFKRGTSMTAGGITVIVGNTPEISQGRVDGDRWHIPVKIQWFAGINT
jgi:hypothetical protein